MEEALSVCELAQVPLLRARFTSSLEAAGVGGDELQGWALTFTEAVNNSVEHGCKNPGDEVAVRWRCDAVAVVVVVRDPGESGMTTQDFDDATCEGFGETGRGAGLFLIRAWADEVHVSSGTDERGNAFTETRIERKREPSAGRTGDGRGTEQ